MDRKISRLKEFLNIRQLMTTCSHKERWERKYQEFCYTNDVKLFLQGGKRGRRDAALRQSLGPAKQSLRSEL